MRTVFLILLVVLAVVGLNVPAEDFGPWAVWAGLGLLLVAFVVAFWDFETLVSEEDEHRNNSVG